MKLKLVPFLIILLTAVFMAQLFLLSQPTQVTALPPRPTPTAVPPPDAPGAKIILQVTGNIANNNWTKIQWQDGNAKWHDVSGWQGELENDGTKTWWVGEDLLGRGPFRWLVLEDGDIVALNESFYLPTTLNETLIVEVDLE